MNNNQRYVAIFFVLVTVLAIWYVYSPKQIDNTEQVFCATDVQQCPDGTFVNRVGPNCEFAACTQPQSVSTNSTATITKTFADAKNKFSFDYPDNFYFGNELAKYISPVQWPPEVSISTTTYSCKPTGKVTSPDGATVQKNINGKIYCLTTQSEGAAGSVYTTYNYKIPIEKKVVSLTFISRAPQCANYDEPQKSECEKEKSTFSFDDMVDKLFKSIKFQ